MKSITLEDTAQKRLKRLINAYPPLNAIVQDIAAIGALAYLVGGAVRDIVCGQLIHDVDIEVHQLELEQLEKILSQYGPVNTVGKSFGVLRVGQVDIDWSLPRTDSSGRKPVVTIDAHMGIERALRRRDITINAMAINLVTGELVDPYDGLNDLHNKQLRAVDDTLFTEDPLRFYRVMQFMGRYESTPDAILNEICKTMSLADVARERIEVEFEKLLLLSPTPSRGIRWLAQLGRLKEIMPELAATQGIDQHHEFHPEGDVFEHSMQAVDAAARLEYENQQDRLTLLWAALCHDLGKATTTKMIGDRLRSIGHELAGSPLARSLLKRIVGSERLINRVCMLVRYHMSPLQFMHSKAGNPAYKRLAHKLGERVSIRLLLAVVRADRRGRKLGGVPHAWADSGIDAFLAKAYQLGVLDHPEEPVLTGADLMPVVKPGPEMGRLLEKAYTIQIEHNITNKAELLKRIHVRE